LQKTSIEEDGRAEQQSCFDKNEPIITNFRHNPFYPVFYWSQSWGIIITHVETQKAILWSACGLSLQTISLLWSGGIQQ